MYVIHKTQKINKKNTNNLIETRAKDIITSIKVISMMNRNIILNHRNCIFFLPLELAKFLKIDI